MNAPVRTSSRIRRCAAVGLLIAAALPWLLAPRSGNRETPSASHARIPPPPSAADSARARPLAQSTGSPAPPPSAFQPLPFKVAQSNGAYAWTAEDGKDADVIRRLAHNELEYRRMMDENGRIYRRQLVYHPEGFALRAQRAVQSGQAIHELTLPGFDDQELQVSVTRTDFENAGDRGVFYGKLPGRPDSLVTVAFIGGREAFTVVSPRDQLYLQAEAREPGEIVVKLIDPNTYAAAPCGNN